MTQEDYVIGCTGCPPLFDESELIDDEDGRGLWIALALYACQVKPL